MAHTFVRQCSTSSGTRHPTFSGTDASTPASDQVCSSTNDLYHLISDQLEEIQQNFLSRHKRVLEIVAEHQQSPAVSGLDGLRTQDSEVDEGCVAAKIPPSKQTNESAMVTESDDPYLSGSSFGYPSAASEVSDESAALATGTLWNLSSGMDKHQLSIESWRRRSFSTSQHTGTVSLNYLSKEGNGTLTELVVLRSDRGKVAALEELAPVTLDELSSEHRREQSRAMHDYQLAIGSWTYSTAEGYVDDIPGILYPFSISWKDAANGKVILATRTAGERSTWLNSLRKAMGIKAIEASIHTAGVHASEGSGSSNQASRPIFNILPVWVPNSTRGMVPWHSGQVRFSFAAEVFEQKSEKISTESYGDFAPESPSDGGCVRKYVMFHPQSMSRVMWDMLSLFLVGYDLIAIPLTLLEMPDSTFWTLMAWITRLFWTVDLVISFATGYIRPDGTLEMSLRKTSIHFLRRWFMLDLTLVVLDWVELILSHTEAVSYMRAGKITKAFRLFRMARLLRFARVRGVLQDMLEQCLSEKLRIVADISTLMIFIMLTSHLIACFWYGLGQRSGTRVDWVTSFFVDNADMHEDSIGYRYLCSLHWAVSQFTGGMDEIVPHNVGERLFALATFFVGFLIAAMAVSRITSSMTRLHILASRQSEKAAILKRWLAQNNISNKLALHVQRNAQHALHEQAHSVPEDKVELLHLISVHLRVELHFDMYSPILNQHPFFMEYTVECRQVMRQVCHTAVGCSKLTRGDVVFHMGEIPANPKVYFVCSGKLQYVATDGSITIVTGAESGTVMPWLSEGALWTHWVHQGFLTVVDNCRLLHVDAKTFQSIVGGFEHRQFDPKTYAQEFVDSLNNANDVPVITDLPFDKKRKSRISVRSELNPVARLVKQASSLAQLIFGPEDSGTEANRTDCM